MKNVLLASGFALVASGAFAGGLDTPVYEPTVMAPEIIEADTVETAGSDKWVMALMSFMIFVVAGIGG